MVRPGTKRSKVFHWIPPEFTARPKITVTRSDGTVDDITDELIMFEFEDGKTNVIGRFAFELWNNREQWTDIWNGGEAVKLYIDYASSATTLRFKGYIEKPNYNNNKIKVSGRSNSQILVDKAVTKQYTNIEASVIIIDLIDTYGVDMTTTNVNTTTVFLNINWSEKPFLDCIKEVTKATGFDAYLDAEDDYHFNEAGNVINQMEAMVHDYNIVELTEFADDLTFVKNKVIVYGAQIDGIQIIKSAKDQDSIDAYNERKLTINDDNITDPDQAQELADFELSVNKDPPVTGEITSIMLATIQPGENINLSSPQNNIPPNNYQIISYKQKFEPRFGYITTVKVNKEPRKFSNILGTMVQNDNLKNQTSVNPTEQENSYNLYFNQDSGTHTDTEIVDGVLKPTGASGSWISNTETLSSNLTEAYLVLIGETLTGVSVSVSGNDGGSYENIANKTKIDLTSAIGQQLRVRVEFTDADTQIDSLSLQFTTA